MIVATGNTGITIAIETAIEAAIEASGIKGIDIEIKSMIETAIMTEGIEMTIGMVPREVDQTHVIVLIDHTAGVLIIIAMSGVM